MIRRCPAVLAGLIVLLAVAPPALAQGGRSEINGTIVDAGKALLPGVTVTAINQDTGLERVTVSSTEGKFTLPTLLPGTYTIKAELQGFQVTNLTGIVVNVGQELTVNLTLQVAGVAETVTVTGQSPLVEATSSRIGTNVTSTEIDGLPSANRSQFSLMQTIPGLVPVLQVGSFEGGQFSANGQATTNNLFLVDGQNDNDSRRGGSQGTQARVSLDSMAEYQVQTHTYAAEYGGSTGVVVNSVTKSGTNKLSGRVFEYYQSNALQATNYFLEAGRAGESGIGQQRLRRQPRRSDRQEQAVLLRQLRGHARATSAANLNFPASAAPLAVSYSTTTAFHGPNTFARFDYHMNSSNQISFRWTREAVITERDSIENDLATLERRAARERFGRPGVQRLVDVGAEQPHDQRIQDRPRARKSAAGAEQPVRRRLEFHRLCRRRSIRCRVAEHAPGLHRRPAQHLRAGSDSRHHHRRHALVGEVGVGRRSHLQGRRRLQPQRRAAARHGRQLHRSVHVSNQREFQSRRSDHLSVPLRDQHGPVPTSSRSITAPAATSRTSGS